MSIFNLIFVLVFIEFSFTNIFLYINFWKNVAILSNFSYFGLNIFGYIVFNFNTSFPRFLNRENLDTHSTLNEKPYPYEIFKSLLSE